MAPGYEVDPNALRQAAQELRSCTRPADGMDIMATVGSPRWYGHAQLYDRLGRFCTTWQAAVALLTERAEGASEQLMRTAARYEAAEQNSDLAVRRAGGPLPF